MTNDQEGRNGEILGRVIPRGAEKRRPPPAGTEFRDVTDTNGNTYKIIMSPFVRIGAPEEEVSFDLYIFQRVETLIGEEVSATFKKLRYQYDIKQIGDGQLKSGSGNFTNDGHAHIVLKLPDKPGQTYLQLRITVHQDGVLQGISTVPFIFMARTIAQKAKPAENVLGLKKGVKIGARTGTQYRIIGGKEVPVKPPDQHDEETTQEFEIPVVMQNPIRTPPKPAVVPDQEPPPADDKKIETESAEHGKEKQKMPEEQQPQEPKKADPIVSQVLRPEKPKKKRSPLRVLLALLAVIAVVVLLCFASLGLWQLAASPDGNVAPERVDCRSSQIFKENGEYVLKHCTPIWN